MVIIYGKSEPPEFPLHVFFRLLLGRFRVSRRWSWKDKVGYGIPELQYGRQEHAKKPQVTWSWEMASEMSLEINGNQRKLEKSMGIIGNHEIPRPLRLDHTSQIWGESCSKKSL